MKNKKRVSWTVRHSVFVDLNELWAEYEETADRNPDDREQLAIDHYLCSLDDVDYYAVTDEMQDSLKLILQSLIEEHENI